MVSLAIEDDEDIMRTFTYMEMMVGQVSTLVILLRARTTIAAFLATSCFLLRQNTPKLKYGLNKLMRKNLEELQGSL